MKHLMHALLAVCLLLPTFSMPMAARANSPNLTPAFTSSVTTDAHEQMTLADQPLLLQYAVSEALERDQSRYHAMAQADGWRVTTPAQGYATHFNDDGFRLTAGESWLQMNLAGIGYGMHLTAMPAAIPTSRENCVEYQRGNATEWYVNGPLGLQQALQLPKHLNCQPLAS